VQISDLFRRAGFPPTRIFDIFKAQTGLLPKDYLRRLRMENQQELLWQTNRSVTKICAAVRFNSG
jgi:transcriptional regulator GlxA family with amidase domain